MAQESDQTTTTSSSLKQIQHIVTELLDVIKFLQDAQEPAQRRQSEAYREKEARFSQLIRELFIEILTSKFEQARQSLLEIGPHLKNKGQDIFDSAYRSLSSIFQSIQKCFVPSDVSLKDMDETDAQRIRETFDALTGGGMSRADAHRKVWRVMPLIKAGLSCDDAVAIILAAEGK
jgi:DNA polymerase III delta prime subunit